jgi:hypothetical protein
MPYWLHRKQRETVLGICVVFVRMTRDERFSAQMSQELRFPSSSLSLYLLVRSSTVFKVEIFNCCIGEKNSVPVRPVRSVASSCAQGSQPPLPAVASGTQEPQSSKIFSMSSHPCCVSDFTKLSAHGKIEVHRKIHRTLEKNLRLEEGSCDLWREHWVVYWALGQVTACSASALVCSTSPFQHHMVREQESLQLEVVQVAVSALSKIYLVWPEEFRWSWVGLLELGSVAVGC